jgi:serine protease AprX
MMRYLSSFRRPFGRAVASLIAIFTAAATAMAGITVVGSNGLVLTQTSGITYTGTSGFVATGADGSLAFAPNGITAPWTSGIAFTGADASTFAEPAGLFASGVDSTTVDSADSFTATTDSVIVITDALGNRYQADSVLVRRPDGIAFTGADGIAFTGADGIAFTGADAGSIVSADGIVATHPSGIAFTGADGVTATAPDGSTFTVAPNGIAFTGVDGIAFTGADGIAFTGADALTLLGLDGLPVVGTLGLQSLDPELADLLDRLTDDSNVDAAVVYHHTPTNADIADLVALGVLGGTRFRALPVVVLTTTKQKLVAISHLPAVRAIYGNRTLQANADASRATTGASRVPTDADLTAHNSGVAVTGAGVTVALLDTGINALHADVAGRVAQNVALLQTPPLVGFTYPLDLENQLDTDLVSGHGTFVGGIIAGNGASSGGRIKGVAPGARLVGLSAGVLDLPHVLAGFDYVLDRGPALGVRVLNCSFSANTVFDVNDPVNVATKLLHDAGVSVVFSAGNTGPGWSSMNPYAVAPWVIGVGATDDGGRLASYSSRGTFGSSTFRPKLVAPGTSVISLRSSPVLGVTGVLGIESGADLQSLSAAELPFYTTSTGTSFSAPQVAGTIALMLEANPSLTPDLIADILQRSASPLPPYLAHEVGAGMLNAHAAVLEAGFPSRRMGAFRASLGRGQVTYANDDSQGFTATVSPATALTRPVVVPANAIQASVEIAWGPVLSTNDLGLSLADPRGVTKATSNAINLPGLTGKRERVTLSAPSAGTWTARVSNSIPAAGTPQPVTGKVEIASATVAPLSDVGVLAQQSQSEIATCVRTLTMFPFGSRFRPTFRVARRDLAQSLVHGGRVPQYIPGQPRFSDVTDPTTEIFVESAQSFPDGALFPDAPFGGAFRPDAFVDRLAAAVALVRAAGYRAEAERRAGATLNLVDANLIPSDRRGYVAVALERGLLTASNLAFRPNDALTRAELAHALAVTLNVGAGNAVAGTSGSDTVGVYASSSAGWFLRYANDPGPADATFVYGPGGGYVPITGDWDGDGTVTPGVYDPATSAFFLRNSSSPGPADTTFAFGAGGLGLVPIAGDWNGDGIDTVGLYDPANGTFFLRNWHEGGPADVVFVFGGGGAQPLVGDWNGDGVDTIGLFVPTSSVFFLKNTNAAGDADTAFVFGAAANGATALAGDWRATGADTIGIYVPSSAVFFLRYANAPGPADAAFTYGAPRGGPVAGHWNG